MSFRLLLTLICAMFIFSGRASADPIVIPPGAPLDGLDHTFVFVEVDAADTAEGQLYFLDFRLQPGVVTLPGDTLEFMARSDRLFGCPFATCVLLHSDSGDFDPVGELEGPFVRLNPNNGTTFTFSIRSPAEVPEPTALLLLGTGLAGVAIKMRNRLRVGRAGKEANSCLSSV